MTGHPERAFHRRIELLGLTILLTTSVLLPARAVARQGEAPPDLSRARSTAALRLPVQDVARLRAESKAARAAGETEIFYAEPLTIDATPDEDGVWTELADGSRLWTLDVHAPGATDVNLGFGEFELPPGAQLWVVDPKSRTYEGPYTWRDNSAHGELWVPALPGDHLRVELRLQGDVKFEPRLRLDHVGYGFLDLFGTSLDRDAGLCNVDIVCPEGDPWRDQARAVAIYSLGGSRLCTGTLVMDTVSSFRPFFLTAANCGVDEASAPSMVVYWNFESPTCGQVGGGSLDQNQTGATLRARRDDVDFALVELDERPDPSFGVFHSGWDRTGLPAPNVAGIHHPNTAEKSISLSDDPLTVQDSCIGGTTPDTHWRVDDWEIGTTEPGSVGSGLWDGSTGLLVGFLSGGLAACGNQESDCYGRFDVAWDGPDSTSRLRDWLDPTDTGAVQVTGADPQPRLFVDAVVATDDCEGVSDGVIAPGETVELFVDLVARYGDVTGIEVTLTSNSPDVTITQGTSSYADALQDSVVTNTTPFTLSVDTTATCFDTIEVVATIDDDLNVGIEEVLRWTVGSAQEPSGLPLAIPDGSPVGANSDLVLDSDVMIVDLEVDVTIDHTYVGDLRIQLRSPAGTVVTLLDRPGEPATPFGCSDDDLVITFSDSAAQDLEDLCTGSSPWYEGVGLPAQALSTFTGESTAGTWTLIVSDNGISDTGVLVDWGLRTSPTIPEGTCTPCESIGTSSPSSSRIASLVNVPNPFNPATEIVYTLRDTGSIEFVIHDVSGRLVRRLVAGTHEPGPIRVRWNGRNEYGRRVSSGVYLVRALVDGRATGPARKMTLVE